MTRRVALVTGVGRRRGIGAGIALGLAQDGWDLALNLHRDYDVRVGLEQGDDDVAEVAQRCRELGVQVAVVAGDLAQPDEPARIVDEAQQIGPVRALVMSHTESVDSSTLTTTVESWDRHFAVNARATWLLIKAVAETLPEEPTTDPLLRVVALTSDHTVHNLPYGASKGALDRLVCAAGAELGGRGLRANVLNPGPIDTGWMDDAIRAAGVAQTPVGRLGTPTDTANVVRFLLSDAGGWINGQVLYSNGGFRLGA